jgi:uncharacterized membrane protein
MIIFILIIILTILSFLIGKKRGIKSVLSLLFNYMVILLTIILINLGCNPYLVCFISCLFISVIIIFYLNGFNVKTKSSFLAIIMVTIIISLLTLFLNNKLDIGGFSYESVEEISAYSFIIDLSLKDIIFVVILLGTVGTISDTSMSISSALYEINDNKEMKFKDLFISGMNVGKDILGTTINTLFFSFISGFIGFLLWHNYNDIVTLINFKAFASSVVSILCSAIGCIIIIPITAIITVYFLKK